MKVFNSPISLTTVCEKFKSTFVASDVIVRLLTSFFKSTSLGKDNLT